MILRGFAYFWASPTTIVLGLPAIVLALLSGGRVRSVEGVFEVSGGLPRWLLTHATLLSGGAAAITFGHVVVGRDEATLERTRIHERVHVAQYERWGPFFVPAYVLASLWVLLRRGKPYRDNPFEREAFAKELRAHDAARASDESSL